MSTVAADPPENDYLSNLDVVERFPFSLYHGPIRQHVLNLIRKQEAQRPYLKILNVGCGLSQVLKSIRRHHFYTGVDVDSRAIEICRNRFNHGSTQFLVSEPFHLPVDSDTFDVVFATEVVEHVLEPEKWLRELVRTAAPSGAVQISTPNYGGWLLPLIENTFLEFMARRQGFTRKGLHPTPFTADALRQLLSSVGLVNVLVEKTPGNLALIGTGYKS